MYRVSMIVLSVFFVSAMCLVADGNAKSGVVVEVIDSADLKERKKAKSSPTKVSKKVDKQDEKASEKKVKPTAPVKQDQQVKPTKTNDVLAKLIEDGLAREKLLQVQVKQLKTDYGKLQRELQNAIKIIRAQQQTIDRLKKQIGDNLEVSL